MPVIQPNTKDMEDFGPTVPGTYPFVVKSCDAKKSKAGNNMIVPKVEISAVDEAGKPTTKTRTAYLVTEGKGTAGFDAFLRALHFDKLADQYRAGEDVPFNTDSTIGQEALVVVDNELYTPVDEQGNPRIDPATGKPAVEKRDVLKNFLKK